MRDVEYFLVGGAVRDRLLGLPEKDLDYVVIGASDSDMTAMGFKQVGADFPVYLHPVTNDEYALARTEKKEGFGYNGFTCETLDVTLEDDLLRRDLTINSMAMDSDGNIIDPHGGQSDLENGVIRHTSAAFEEDPVRVLRAARLAARYKFVIAAETMDLMRGMVINGELDHLTPERVWAETEKALGEEDPAIFFAILKEAGALQKIMPEIKQVSLKVGTGSQFAFASLIAEQDMTRAELNAMVISLKIPNRFRDVARVAQIAKGVQVSDAEAMFSLLKQTNALRKSAPFSIAVHAVMSPANAEKACEAWRAANDVSAASLGLDVENMDGKDVGRAIMVGRLQAIHVTVAAFQSA